MNLTLFFAAHTARRPQQAGPTSPLVTAGHLAGVEAAGLTGDPRQAGRCQSDAQPRSWRRLVQPLKGMNSSVRKAAR